MQTTRHQFLAGTAFTGDQDGSLGSGDLTNMLAQRRHDLGFPHHLPIIGAPFHLPFQASRPLSGRFLAKRC